MTEFKLTIFTICLIVALTVGTCIRLEKEGAQTTIETINPSVTDTMQIIMQQLNSAEADTSVVLIEHIPYTEVRGLKYVNVNIDGVAFDALYDTGSGYSIAIIPDTYYALVDAGIITANEFSKKSSACQADGTEIKQYHFDVPEIHVGNTAFHNQEVAVMQSGHLNVIGCSLWPDAEAFVIDNVHHEILIIETK